MRLPELASVNSRLNVSSTYFYEEHEFAVCVDNYKYEVSPEVRKLYEVVADADALNAFFSSQLSLSAYTSREGGLASQHLADSFPIGFAPYELNSLTPYCNVRVERAPGADRSVDTMRESWHTNASRRHPIPK